MESKENASMSFLYENLCKKIGRGSGQLKAGSYELRSAGGGRVGCGITRSLASTTLACRNRFNHTVTPIDGANIWHSHRFKSTQNLFGPQIKGASG